MDEIGLVGVGGQKDEHRRNVKVVSRVYNDFTSDLPLLLSAIMSLRFRTERT